MNEELLDLIRISKSSVLSRLILENFSVKEVLTYALNLESERGKILLPEKSIAEKELSDCQKLGISLISFTDPSYPLDLKNIENPPLILFAKGNLNLLLNPKFAIVGARSATFESLNIAQTFATELSQFGFTIVSGFAFGVDTASCVGASKFGTIQILGSGVDKIYPKENKKLYDEVLQNGGLFASEFPPSFPVRPENFPLRNRIVSGVSKGVLIVQAGKKNRPSGSLITAKIALKQEKDLFAIPAHPMDTRFEGGNDLLKNGNAIFTTSTQDIIDMIGYHVAKKARNFEFRSKNLELDFEKQNASYNLEPKRNLCVKIRHILGSNPLLAEEIANLIGEDVKEVKIAIAEMELVNEVQKHRNGGFSLTLV